MRIHALVSTAAASIFVCTLSLMPAKAASNLLFVLDSSGSMWGQLEGRPKMETAKAALSKLVGDLPSDTSVGLMAYGHRLNRNEPSACADIELLMPVGKANSDGVASWLSRINPKGKTPIADSLLQSPTAFAGLEGNNNNIVLISDGIETCDGDPCAVAGDLAASNINVRVHVVGFDISTEDRAQLECIAEQGNGRYFPANSTADFTNAVTDAVRVAQVETAPDPVPELPQAITYFEDGFDGVELAAHWEVDQLNPDAFIVEDGKLLVINSTLSSLEEGNVENLFRLANSMPDGDWTMTARLMVEFQTAKEQIFFGLHNSESDFIMMALSAPQGWNNIATVQLNVRKMSGGSAVDFSKEVWNGGVDHPDYSASADSIPQPIQVRLAKLGRSYIASAMVEGVDDPQWVDLDKVTSLRAKGNLAMGIGQSAEFSGETLANIDWIKIETVE